MQKTAKKLDIAIFLGLTYIDWSLGAKNPNFPNFRSQKSISFNVIIRYLHLIGWWNFNVIIRYLHTCRKLQ